MSSGESGASGTGAGSDNVGSNLFQKMPNLLRLPSPPKAPITFLSRLHGKLSPHLTGSNLQRFLVTLFILVISYAILTTPEARRKVMKILGPPRWIMKRIRKRLRRMYSKLSGRTLDESEDGFFIEAAPKKSRAKKGGRRKGSIGGIVGGRGDEALASDGADARVGRSSFLGGKLRRPTWSYLSEEKRSDAAKAASDVPSGKAANGGMVEVCGGDTSSVGAGGRVHLTRTSLPVASNSSTTPTTAAAVASRGMLSPTTPDMSTRRRNRYAAAAAMPSPIYERNELGSPSPQPHKSPRLHHAHSMASPPRLSPTKATTAASSLCTGLFLPASSHPEKEEETDHDRFTRAWPRIRSSAYGRLVLPPECRFVGHSARADEEGLEGDETAVMSWWLWFLHLLLKLLRKSKDRAIIIATCDYAAVLTAAYLQLMDYIRYKRDKKLGRPTPDEEDDEEDDDDEEEDEDGEVNDTVGSLNRVSSSSSLRQMAAGLVPAIRDRFYSVDPNAHVNDEEKKDSAADRAIISTKSESLAPNRDTEGGPTLTPIVSHHGATETWSTPNDLASSSGTPGGMMRSVDDLDLAQNTNDSILANQTTITDSKPKSRSRFVLTAPGGDGSAESGKGAILTKRDNLETCRTNISSTNSSFLSDRTMPDLSPRPLLQSRSTPLLSNVASNASVSPEMPLRSRDDSQPEASVDSPSQLDLAFFDAPVSNASLKRLNRDVPLPVPDKNGYIIGDDLLPDSQWTPLLVFVNSRSGPQQGQLILMQLRRLLNPIQIWDLADGDPTTVLRSFLVLSRLKILVCGGDGTVSWIISTLESMKLERRWPPLAILPLGTGNDLARIHGWGAGYNNESILAILEQITEAYVSLLDRWELTIESKKGKTKDTKSFMNYLGVGVDAQTALGFHQLRENRPGLFFSRAVNKAWYVFSGAEDAIKASCAGLPEDITLIADGVEVPIPPDSQGIILLNIESYAGGVPLWSHGERPQRPRGRRHSDGDLFARQRSSSSDDFDSEEFARELDYEEKLSKVTACDMPSSCQDGLLDIVSIKSIFHMGQIKVGLSRAQLVCQCSEVEIRLKKKVPVQIDGEPWKQNSGTIRIRRKKEPALMLHRAAAEGGGIETEVGSLLEWAEERKIIDKNVHATLMKEFSRRIESKTRARRVGSNDNLFSTMKRAIGATSPPY
mmetsp:Transcript_6615/g.18486  ORF Transcript_6615/g.18486 Transcript_6615/m.18486 type:complete len:1177 (-) Transcript_6615:1413-4943(-)|eukprot:CAMPEP_0181027286 /NCGR_PEP_ID=MMETSP1070-20121207/4085_1 /TAXON_ID=265543 /ORGANISM="Minutocellus polymorphus, Strain NH13" /LENGTH=1176 /DNA_ID=CAMNT_0023104521 /DNA_START=213 /DNA_END=3743 /DNA_ORIENTATION=-